VRRTLIEQQARSLHLPIGEVFIAKDSTNEDYEFKMGEVLTRFKQEGVSAVVYGDIFLEWVRKYREANLAKLGVHVVSRKKPQNSR
jgi:diphthamide synthase (EF-2-diphthine--ammonia ligase)